VAGTAQGTVTVYSLTDWTRTYPLDQLPDGVGAIAISPDGAWVAVGGLDGTLHLWDFATKRRAAPCHHDWGITALAFTLDGGQLISTGRDETLRVWRCNGDGP
jgi:WD40 repeat protein